MQRTLAAKRRRAPSFPIVAGALGAVLLASCSGVPRAVRCNIEVASVEEYLEDAGKVDLAYRVRGNAGSRAKVWLAAKTVEGRWLSGYALDVGPGPFAAIVDIQLTGRAAEYKAVLEVADGRCADEAPRP